MAIVLQSPSSITHSPAVNAGLAVLRIAIGVTIAAHGWQKLFQMGIPGLTQGFTQMGVPLPGITAPLVAILEFFGGIALVFGLLSRLAAAGIAIDMLGAIFMVHLANGFFLPNGIEFTFVLFAGAAAIVLMGPGAYSLDHVIAERRRGTTRPT